MSSAIPKTCQEVLAQLSAFLDGELDATLCTKIEQHLAECPYCHTVADTVQTMLALYRHAQTVMPPTVQAHLQALHREPHLQQNARVS